MRALWHGLAPAFRRMGWLARKEFWQLHSDGLFTAMLIVLPLLQMVLVVNVVGRHEGPGNPIALVDHDRSPLSRDLVEAIENTKEAYVRLRLPDMEAGDAALLRGEVDGLVVVPPHLARDLKAPDRTASLLVVTDGTNTFGASQINAAVGGALSAFAASALGGAVTEGLEVRRALWFEITRIQDPVSTQFGFLLYEVVLMVSALSLARERESGTLEQLLVAPLKRVELVAGKALPALVVGIFNFWILFAVGQIFWDVPVRGSLMLLFTCGVLFILAQSAWGLFLSSRVSNQQQAVQLIFLQILFDMAFCGYVVPVQNLPRFLSWISELLPVRHYLECVRMVMLRGGGLEAVAPRLGALLALNLVYWLLSVAVLRQRLE
jgi:ABC-2 type transport system permease protein